MKIFQVSTWREGNLYVAQCLEIDIASQGATPGEAHGNLREALELFFEVATTEEIESRLRAGVEVSRLEVAIG